MMVHELKIGLKTQAKHDAFFTIGHSVKKPTTIQVREFENSKICMHLFSCGWLTWYDVPFCYDFARGK